MPFTRLSCLENIALCCYVPAWKAVRTLALVDNGVRVVSHPDFSTSKPTKRVYFMSQLSPSDQGTYCLPCR